jgi:hypothetical protein
VYSGGLAYINRGTAKHWVSGGALVNMLAWGSNQFDNRIHYGWDEKCAAYDQRLRGRHTIAYYLLPYGAFDGNRICADVEAFSFPVFAAKGKSDITFHAPMDDTRMVTALHEKDGAIYARGYTLPGCCSERDFEIFELHFR